MANKISRRTFLLSSLATLATVLSGCATSRNPLRQVSTRPSVDLGDNVEMLYIRAVQNGEHKSFVYRGSELNNGQHISIDGYITAILSFNKKEVKTRLNRKLMGLIEKGSSHICLQGKCIYPKDLVADDYCITFFDGLVKNLKFEKPDGVAAKDSYGIGKFNGWLPFSDTAVHQLSFPGKRIFLRNIVSKKFFSKDGKHFYYLGNDYERLRKGVESRVDDICSGITNVEKFYGMRLIDRINFIDYNVDNASADQKQGFINFFNKALDKPDLHNTVEHETLHRFVFEAGYTQDRQIRKLFFELKGKDEPANIVRGFEPFAGYMIDYDNKDFFYFINEENYFSHNDGGHSHSNIWEFCTSFFHTLMYFDRFEENLSKLSEDKQSNVIDCYTRTLTTMMGKNKRYDTMLRQRLDYMTHLNYKKS